MSSSIGKSESPLQNSRSEGPLVSIIITSYNYGRYLAGAIESALKQNYKNIEIIVVDDGSTDNTRNVASNYPVRYVFQNNQGVANARNNGIKLSSGEFFTCLDADDELASNYVQRTLERILRNPFIGFVSVGSRVWSEDTHLEDLWIPRPRRELRKYSMFGGWNGPLCSVLTRRAAFESLDYGFDSSLQVYEDLDFYLRVLLKRWKGEAISEPLMWGRLHKGSRNEAPNEIKKHVESLMNRKYRFIEPYKKLYSFYRSTFGRLISLMSHPVLYLNGFQEKVRIRTWIMTYQWNSQTERENAWEYASEISRTIDKQIDWSYHREIGNYHQRRLGIVKSRLLKAFQDDAREEYKMMTRKSLVSIIIPTFNYGHYIAGTIESALKQTYPNTEILVIDDGSTDNTRDIVGRYSVKYVYQENQGVSAAMNKGIKESHGDFFVCLGADDKLYPEYIRKTMIRIKENPKIGFVCTGSKVFDEEMGLYNIWIPHKIRSKYALFSGWVGVLGSVLTRRAAFDSLNSGFDTSLPLYEDLDLCFRLLRKGWQIGEVPEPLHWYRIHKGSRNSAEAGRKRYTEKLINRKYGFIELYRIFHVVFQRTVGRTKSLIAHPFEYMKGLREKIIIKIWMRSCHSKSHEIDEAQKLVEEISLTIDKQVEWSRNPSLHDYYERRLRVLESYLRFMISKRETPTRSYM